MIPHQENGGEAAWMDEEDGGGAAARINVEEVLTKPLQSSPGGKKKIYTSSAKRKFDGMGWDETGYQMGPSIFCILCRCIDKVYTYLYM